jgi:putative tryptophan/tyrosine transport system substrate-binding protein
MQLKTLRLVVMLALVLFTASRPAHAQLTGKVYRIGWLHEGVRPLSPPFLEAMRVRGYVYDHNFFIERRPAETREQLPALAAELVTLKVDLIVTNGTPATRAAQQATTTIPIVFYVGADPVQSGLVASFAQPGGNLTGFVGGLYPDKQLEILKETVPGLVRVACLCSSNPENPGKVQIIDAARVLGLEILDLAVLGPDDFAPFFVAARRAGAQAVIVGDAPWFSPHHARLGELAAQSRLPAIGSQRPFAEAGGLLSFAHKQGENNSRLVAQIDKILQGTKPADLPVERPMRFEVVINLKTAKALGIAMPPSLLLLADEVIQ